MSCVVTWFFSGKCNPNLHSSCFFLNYAGDEIVQRCSVLMRMDYTVTELANQNGELSAHYPAKLLIPEQELKKSIITTNFPVTAANLRPRNSASPQSTGSNVTDSVRYVANRDQVIVDGRLDAQRLRYLILRARLARCRARFPLPVILYKGKFICRSATLSGGPEIYGRSGLEYFAYAAEATLPEPGDEAYEAQEDSSSDESDSKDWPLFGRLRRKDIRLLKALNVGTIIDFMVENKKVKFWLNVTSSEKVDKENRYSFFKILALPYPGCEFFREYRDNDCRGEGLIFDWNQSYVDAGIRVPDDSVTAELNIDWHNYKQWDLVKLTQNYLRLLLKYLQENNSGLLVHCISGWDRTPLFVSLLRISLWADGAVHQSLSAAQMLYFTIAYDWLLFGHNLPDRLNKGEVIFYFCFYILKYIVDDEFSVLTRTRSHHSSGSSSIGVIRTDSESMLDGLLFDAESRGSSISLNSMCSFTSGRSSSMHDTQTCISTGIGLTSDGASNSIAIIGRNNGASRNSGTSGGGCNGNEGINSFNGNNGFSSHSNDSSSSIGCISHDSSNHNIQWSPQSKRTSPVTVPSADRLLRQRQESTSSLSVGSWQMITCTGSYRSAESVNEMQSHLQPNALIAQCPNHHQRLQIQGGLQQPPNNHLQSPPHQQQQHQININCGSHSASTPNANQHHSQETSCCTVIDGEYFPNRVDLYALRREKLTQLRTLFYNCYFSTIAFKFNSGPDSALGSLLGNFAEKVGLASRTPV
ncbi:myotubularin-related protein 14 isoform X2 [Malaya genurostris]|uniref:myotubularin-related protein 14 isoform X2 n=1 Tax=Malaya genurostris TaxID=325434 RepID=UPI0026F3C027|nr:myotubularin-related protein 14 isoform X2 [Malaya genurostris]